MIDGKVTISTQDYHDLLERKEELVKLKRSLEKRILIVITKDIYSVRNHLCAFELKFDDDVPEGLKKFLEDYKNDITFQISEAKKFIDIFRERFKNVPNWVRKFYKLDKYDTGK